MMQFENQVSASYALTEITAVGADGKPVSPRNRPPAGGTGKLMAKKLLMKAYNKMMSF
jgi:hypothetical protein